MRRIKTFVIIIANLFLLTSCQIFNNNEIIKETIVEKDNKSITENQLDKNLETIEENFEEIKTKAETEEELDKETKSQSENETINETYLETTIELESETEIIEEIIYSYSNSELAISYYESILETEAKKIEQTDPSLVMASNAYTRFALQDFNGDGIPELLLSELDTSLMDKQSLLYGFDTETKKVYEITRLGAYPQIYENGYIINRGHNPNQGWSTFPFALLKLDYKTGEIEFINYILGKNSEDVEKSPYKNGETGEVFFWYSDGEFNNEEIITASEHFERLKKYLGDTKPETYPDYLNTKDYKSALNLINFSE